MITLLERQAPLFDTFCGSLGDSFNNFLQAQYKERSDVASALKDYNQEVKQAGLKLKKFIENKAGF